jgi:hypothetical protein
MVAVNENDQGKEKNLLYYESYLSSPFDFVVHRFGGRICLLP